VEESFREIDDLLRRRWALEGKAFLFFLLRRCLGLAFVGLEFFFLEMVFFFGFLWAVWRGFFIPMEFWGEGFLSFLLDIRYVMHVCTTRAICF